MELSAGLGYTTVKCIEHCMAFRNEVIRREELGQEKKQRHRAWLTTATLAAQARMIGVSPWGVSM